ncbi:hypothetical protein KY361_05225 [Candidatus Woesearchaeota archaeon]|nr:hypothetical protein [Candidatus Woesearchaeota archaeon]
MKIKILNMDYKEAEKALPKKEQMTCILKTKDDKEKNLRGIFYLNDAIFYYMRNFYVRIKSGKMNKVSPWFAYLKINGKLIGVDNFVGSDLQGYEGEGRGASIKIYSVSKDGQDKIISQLELFGSVEADMWDAARNVKKYKDLAKKLKILQMKFREKYKDHKEVKTMPKSMYSQIIATEEENKEYGKVMNAMDKIVKDEFKRGLERNNIQIIVVNTIDEFEKESK